MKSSLLILLAFAGGVLVGLLHFFPVTGLLGDIGTYILYLLMFLVGLGIGCDSHVWKQLRQINFRILLIPFTSLIGTALGIGIYQLLFPFPHRTDLCAIGAGMGYYSLSSIIISKVSGESVGIIALLANIIREVATLVLAPLLAKYFGKLAPIAAGGATTSDTTLPVIMQYCGKENIVSSIVNGVVITLLVPVIIAFIYGL